MKVGVFPTVDYVFKRIFGVEANAPVLVSLLQAVLAPPPGKGVTGLSYVDPASEKESPEDKQTIADIKARDQGGRQFHVEMQWRVPWFFTKRVLLYWSKFHSQQLWVGESYQTIRETVVVCFLTEVAFPDVPRHHLKFEVRDELSGVRLCPDLVVHLIELPKFTKRVEDLETDLDRWCYFLKHGADLDPDALPPTMDVPAIRRAMEVLNMFTQDEIERERYEQRRKWLLDERSMEIERREGMERATKAGLEQGLEQGLEKGLLIGSITANQRVLKQPPTPAAELLKLSNEALESLDKDLQRQLGLNGH